MIVGIILKCKVCETKIRIRYQVGFIEDIPVKVACPTCGRLFKGLINHNKETFWFPDDEQLNEYDPSLPSLTMSGEIPVFREVGKKNFSPFMSISDHIKMEYFQRFVNTIPLFLKFDDLHGKDLETLYELFRNQQWQYFLAHSIKSFNLPESKLSGSFLQSTAVLSQIHSQIFQYITTSHYETTFSRPLNDELFSKLAMVPAAYDNLASELENLYDLESEYNRGLSLLHRFYKNYKSFIQVICLSYFDNFEKEFLDTVILTSFEFNDLKEMYIEQFEFLGKNSVLNVGLLNIARHEDHDRFGDLLPTLTLRKYHTKSNGLKKEVLTQIPTFSIYYSRGLDNRLRNGIGHLKTIYDTKGQLITYYPFNDFERQNQASNIYLVDFAFQVLQQVMKVRNDLDIISRFINRIEPYN